MSKERAIEQIIREGIERGDFDNLKGKGKPLDLDDYFNAPEDVRMGYSILKANEFVPEEIERMKEIKALQARIETSSDQNELHLIKKELRDKTLALTLILEKNKRRS